MGNETLNEDAFSDCLRISHSKLISGAVSFKVFNKSSTVVDELNRHTCRYPLLATVCIFVEFLDPIIGL